MKGDRQRKVLVRQCGGQRQLSKARGLGLGFSARLDTAFIERVNLTIRDARLRPCLPHLGNFSAVPIPVGPFGVVAGLLPFCPSAESSSRVGCLCQGTVFSVQNTTANTVYSRPCGLSLFGNWDD
jgi:hypothetical protein